MADTNNNKIMAVLCYLWILWIIPLLTGAKDDSFVKFHINQGIILTICSAVVWVIGFIPAIGGVISWIGGIAILVIGGIAILVLSVIGIINAVNMEEKPVPVVGTLLTVIK